MITEVPQEGRFYRRISDFVMPHVGVSTLCTVKGVDKVKRLTTCTCEWNVGCFPSIPEIISTPEFGFVQVRLISAKRQCF